MLKQNFAFLAIMLSMGLLLTFVFGASLGKAYRPLIYVVDQDNTNISKEIISSLSNNDTFQFNQVSTKDEAYDAVEHNKAVAAVIIENGFSKSLIDMKDNYVSIVRQQEFMEVVQLENLLSLKIMEVNNFFKISDVLYDYSLKYDIILDESEYKAQILDKLKFSWQYKKTLLTNETLYEVEETFKYNSLIHSMIGFTLFFTTYPILFNMADIVNDKKKRTFGRILISPISKYQYLIGNLIFTLFIGILMISVFVILGDLLFGINWGNKIMLIMFVYTSFVLCMSCLSLFVSGFVKSYAQLTAISPILLTSLGMLGGCMWPLEIVSNKIMLFLANMTPHKWAIQAIEQLVYYGSGADIAYKSIGILLIMSLFYFLFGIRVMKIE